MSKMGIDPFVTLLLIAPLFFGIGVGLQWLMARFAVTPFNSLLLTFGLTGVIEALIQAVSSAAFLVPGALGLQEAGFIGIGALVGLDPATAAALAVARRVRDLLLFLPGLAAWAWAERRGGLPRRQPTT